MAKMTKKEYQEQGRADFKASRARGTLVALRFARTDAFWQAKAYWEGFDGAQADVQCSPQANHAGDALAYALSATKTRKPNTRGMMDDKGAFFVRGPLYPPRTKARSKRGWTAHQGATA